MAFLGDIVNGLAIVVGAIIGLIVKRGLPEKWQETIMSGIALSIVVIGTKMALATQNIVVVIVGLALGAIIGEICDLEGGMQKIGDWIGDKLAGGSKTAAAKIAQGFASASVLFCSGAMAIVGSIQSGLANDHATLYAKATLDGIIALVMTANLGVGVVFSSLSVIIYQGAIVLMSGIIEPYITQKILNEVTSSGGIMIMAIGFNMLNLTHVRIANMVPGMFVAAVLAHFFL
ncbi:MAG: DUF554 domain-containing protein [Phascolarctobacterium sp.]|nr:DUF554 domain-containing protein [Phascolarctobacterium sp.]